MYKIVCHMEVMGAYVEISADVNECMVFSSMNEAENEIETLKAQDPSNKYEIKELTEEEIELFYKNESMAG